MPKLKTKKGAAKRFKLSSKGKLKYHPGGKGHLLTSKESERIRAKRRGQVLMDKQQTKYVKRMLPYR